MKLMNGLGAMAMTFAAGIAIMSDHELKIMISVIALVVAVMVATGIGFGREHESNETKKDHRANDSLLKL